ncbi:MAG: hypothetical protein ACI8ZB_003495 [Desulforhopalus sp.]|jgi:hypothetical protein
MNFVCEICGNEFENGSNKCPFCGYSNEESRVIVSYAYTQKTVNLEMGRPSLEVALNQMAEVIADGQRNNVNVLTLIHGYGSSGRGGVIRTECRKTLDFMKRKGRIYNYICGEDFNKRSAPVKSILRRYPELESHKNMNRENRGITLVILA